MKSFIAPFLAASLLFAAPSMTIHKAGGTVVTLSTDEIDSITFDLGSSPSTYPIHTGINASTFWVGEHGSDDNFNISNVGSAWDSHWGDNFGLEDGPTISRDANYIPTSSAFKKKENPFYVALPYNDFQNVVYDGSNPSAVVSKKAEYSQVYNADYGREVVVTSAVATVDYVTRKKSISSIYWKDSEKWTGKSMVKGRWVKISYNGKTTYAQWADAGPYYYDDADYVFGTSKPMIQQIGSDSPNAGIDLSPSAMLSLGVTLTSYGANLTNVSWQFVDFANVPDGPWKKYISSNATNW